MGKILGKISWKKFIKNLSIRQKMLLALTLCVILPIILLGIITTTRVLRLSEQNQYEIQINQLTKSGKDVEKLYDTVIQEISALAGDRSIQAIAAGNASVMDFKNAAKSMLEASEMINSCSSIALSKNGQVLFQRGPRYMDERENTEYTRQIEEENVPYLWAAEHPVTFKRGINVSTLSQISYYMTIMKGLTLENEGVIRAHINAPEFIGQFTPYQGENMIADVFIFDKQGSVLAENSNNEELRNLCWEEFQNQGESGDSGYFPVKTGNEGYIVLYTKCGSGGWYLFQVEEKISIYNTQITFIVCAVLLCVVFGFVYSMIQNRTIIMPLHHLSKRIDVVKSGVLEKRDYETAHDEMGNVEKGFEDMVSHINELINQVYIQTIKTQDAEREMLLAKMNPHFLYNSLDSIHWLAIRNKDYEVSEQLEALADVYRHILRFGEGMISIRDDMEFIDNYLFLLDFQMGDRVAFINDIPEELHSYLIPKLITQPLVENAVQHGLRDVNTGGKVKIRMRRQQEDLVITVLDNGVGCDVEKIRKLLKDKEGKGAFALRNIDERVRLRYGDGYGLKMYSKKGIGCMVQVKVKLEAKV